MSKKNNNVLKAIVTGASEGIGREFAKQLAKKGYQLTVVARNEERLRSIIKEIGGQGHLHLVCDLSTESGLTQLEEHLKTHHYNLLVNNAGIGHFHEFQTTPKTKWEEMVQLNCVSLMNLAHTFLQSAKKGDALINVASVLAFHAMPYNTVYAATKAFVLSFSEGLWWEQKNRGVYVSALCPGYTVTEFAKRAGVDETKKVRTVGQTPEEVVKVALQNLEKKSAPFYISGGANKAYLGLQRLFTRKSALNIMGKIIKKTFPEMMK